MLRMLSVSCSTLLLLVLLLASCDGTLEGFQEIPGIGSGAPDPDEAGEMAYPTYALPLGAEVEVCRTGGDGANLRSGPSSNYLVLACLSDGTKGTTKKQSGSWFQIVVDGRLGWIYGKYLCLVSTPSGGADAGVGMGVVDSGTSSGGGAGSGIDVSRDGIIKAAASFLGFSYWYGGARLEVGSTDFGKCYSLSSHSGPYGADCSGYVSKVWQLPEAMPFNKNAHPFSTYSFYNEKTHWDHISRDEARKADAMVYRSNGGGHVVIYESGDAWDKAWIYESQGCAKGIIHRLTTLGSSYQARRRHGLPSS